MYDTRVIHRDNGKEDGDHHIRMGYIYVYIYIYVYRYAYIYIWRESIGGFHYPYIIPIESCYAIPSATEAGTACGLCHFPGLCGDLTLEVSQDIPYHPAVAA